MTYNIAVCDDDTNAIIEIHNLLKKLELTCDMECEITHFHTPKDLLKHCTTSGLFHAMFLDVEMPKMNGLELAHHIRNRIDKHVKIVFVSNYPQYMQDSFPTNPYDYLTKPIQEEELEKVVRRLQKDYEESYIYKALLQADGTEEFINIHDLYYIENEKGLKQQLKFALKDRFICCGGNLKDWEAELAEHHFFSPHRGVLVNIEHIHFINNGVITLTNKKTLPISRRQEQTLKALFARRIYAIHRE